MAIVKDRGRQYPLWAYQQAALADLPTGVTTDLIDLPPNAVIVDGFLETSEGFNAGTSAVMDVGITGTPTKFLTDSNVAAPATVSFAVAVLAIPTGTTGTKITVTPTYVGTAATLGKLWVGVAYVIRARANENQPY
jgi:hypothetical protein